MIVFSNTEILLPNTNSYGDESDAISKYGKLSKRIFDKATIILGYINGNIFIERSPSQPNIDLCDFYKMKNTQLDFMAN